MGSSHSPPRLSMKLPEESELPKACKLWSDVELPIDILLVTMDDCEFLSCFFFLDNPYKSYCKQIGFTFFGSMGGGDQGELKIGLIKCPKGSIVPGGSLPAVKNAFCVLRPKAVFSVGACSGLSYEKTKLGDVVVASKVTTPAFKAPVSGDVGNIIRYVAVGWVAPLENPDEWKWNGMKVHREGDVLSMSVAASLGWRYEDIIQKYPEARAVTEGEGKTFCRTCQLAKLESAFLKFLP